MPHHHMDTCKPCRPVTRLRFSVESDTSYTAHGRCINRARLYRQGSHSPMATLRPAVYCCAMHPAANENCGSWRRTGNAACYPVTWFPCNQGASGNSLYHPPELCGINHCGRSRRSVSLCQYFWRCQLDPRQTVAGVVPRSLRTTYCGRFVTRSLARKASTCLMNDEWTAVVSSSLNLSRCVLRARDGEELFTVRSYST